MKKLLFTLALGLLGSFCQLQAQYLSRQNHNTSNQLERFYSLLPLAAPAQTQQVVSRWQVSKDYDWNDTTQSWKYAEEGRYIYDSKGNLMVRYYLAPTTLDTMGKLLYGYNSNNQQTWRGSYVYDAGSNTYNYTYYDSTYYDAAGNQILQITRVKDVNNQFVNNLQVINIYDAQGNRLETRTESWDPTAVAWTVVSARKNDYTYTPGGNIETIITYNWDSNNQVYTPIERDTFLLDAQGTPKGYYAYRMTGAGYKLRWFFDSISWYSYTNPLVATSKPARYVLKGRGTGSWQDSTRTITTYQANGSYSILSETRTIGGWLPRQRQTSSYNNLGYYLGLYIESYSSSTLSWRGLIGFRRQTTYAPAPNDIDLQEVINQSLDMATQSWYNTTKAEYSNFLRITALPGGKAYQAIKCYPNPANKEVNILTKAGYEGHIRLTNMVGQLIHEQKVEGLSTETIDLNKVAPGIYHLELTQTGQPVKVGRLVVE